MSKQRNYVVTIIKLPSYTLSPVALQFSDNGC